METLVNKKKKKSQRNVFLFRYEGVPSVKQVVIHHHSSCKYLACNIYTVVIVLAQNQKRNQNIANQSKITDHRKAKQRLYNIDR